MEQMDIILAAEKEEDETDGVPTKRDVERYYYYVERGVPRKYIAPQPKQQLKKILDLVPDMYQTSARLAPLYQQLLLEVNENYMYSACMAVEVELFPDLRNHKLLLRTIKWEEAIVTHYTDQAMEVFLHNTVGPRKNQQLVILNPDCQNLCL
nr:hypothetical protein BaRGS_024307 [Batillaria attramentaria]